MEKMKLNIQLFAPTITTTITEGAINDEENSSYVGITAYFTANNSSTYFNNKNIYFYCKRIEADGVTETDITPTYYDYTSRERTMSCSLSKGGSVSKFYVFYHVPHLADGSLKVRCYWTIATGTSGLGTITESQTQKTQTMTTIPRASVPTLSSSTATLGSAITINTNRASTSFTHTIRYAFGSTSGTIASNVTDSTTWTPALTLAQQIPNATSGQGTIYCDTYQSGTLVGTNSIALTLQIPSSMKPTTNAPTITEANSTMTSLNWGVYVQNKSQLRIQTSGSGVQGSSISKNTIQINGGTTYESSDYTSGVATTTTANIFTNVQDSRGVWGDGRTTTISIVPYANPQIIDATATRCDSSGNEDEDGTWLKYSFEGSISPVSNHNAHTFRIGYREKNTGSYSYTNIDTTNYSIDLTDKINLNLDTSKTYDIIFEAVDTFTTTSILRQVNTAFVIMDFNASGKAMAIGKVSEASSSEELLEIGMPTKIDGRLNVTGDVGANGVSTKFIELGGNGLATPFIDFHYNNSSADYTSRIIEYASGTLGMNNNLSVDGTLTAGGEIKTTGNDSGVSCDNVAVGRKTKFTVSGGGNTGFYDNTNGNWIIRSDTGQNVYIPHPLYINAGNNRAIGVVGESLNASKGYVELSNGLILNWGSDSISSTSSSGNFTKAITFQKAYTSSPFFISVNREGSNAATYWTTYRDASNTGFTAVMSCQTGYSATWSFKWFAIGK